MPEENHKIMRTYVRAAPLFERGEGTWLIDTDGNRYLDWISGIGATCLGHGHPVLARALADQAATLGHISNLYRNGPAEELSERLCARTGADAVFFSNSGSEANEAAIKLSRKIQRERGAPGRQTIVALNGGFHGRTFGSLSITSNAKYREPFGEMLDAEFVDPGDLRGLESALAKEPAALFVEPIQGEGGLRSLCGSFLKAARNLCDSTGTILVHDEVQCGGGRTGSYLAGEFHGIVPDVVTLAKPLGAGLPIGATLARGEAASVLVPGDHGSTFGGGTMACRAALTVLDELDAGLQEHVIDITARLTDALDDMVLRHESVAARRGRGLMQGLLMHDAERAGDVITGLLERGVLACTAAGGVVRFLPPYILSVEDLDTGLERLDSAISSLSAAPAIQTAS